MTLEPTEYQIARQAQRGTGKTRHARYQSYINIARQSPNITFEEFIAFEEAFDGACTICGTEIDAKTRHLDHCHKTGKMRGWLCPTCNVGLGMFKDDVDLLEKAIEYLRRQ